MDKIDREKIKFVKTKVLHPAFIEDSASVKDPSKGNNVGLLFLEEDYTLNENLNVVCLPTTTDYNDYLPETCIATGFGKRPEFQTVDEIQTELKALPIPIITNSECTSWISKILGFTFNPHESQLCAGVQGSFETDTCEGDGGAPLVCNKKSDPNTFVQMALVSARLSDADCGTSSIPGIYSDVANSMCMIKSIVQHEVCCHFPF